MENHDRLQRLQWLQEDILLVGQAFYRFEQQVEQQSQEFFQCLEWLEAEVKRESAVEQEYRQLQYRISRYQNFGEPLD